MATMKKTRKYYFTVEGETEQWYFEWLQKQINDEPSSNCNAAIKCVVQKDPLKYTKTLTVTHKTIVTHVVDYESGEPVHTKQFAAMLERMRKAESLGKQIKYRLGYSNFSFELWMVLHKTDCNGHLTHRDHYLALLNRAYAESFENLDQYKHEDNFHRILRKLSLADVRLAVQRAEAITRNNEESGYVLQKQKGYSYYRENPSLSIGVAIAGILRECGLM
jgi:hypothetical protein